MERMAVWLIGLSLGAYAGITGALVVLDGLRKALVP